FESPHDVALEHTCWVIVLGAGLRFTAVYERRHQVLFFSPATGILLVTESINAYIFERIGECTHETLALDHRKIGVPDVVGFVKQQPEAKGRSFGIVEWQCRQPDRLAVGARLSPADSNVNASFLAEHRPQDMERAFNRKLL